MPQFRVTKYDPGKRIEDGSYAAADWTSISDIGKAFGNKVLSEEEYLRAEDCYVESVRRCMDAANVASLVVKNIEKGHFDHLEHMTNESAGFLRNIEESAVIAGDQLDWVVRAALREILWCRLAGEGGFFVHFGYDYYMYIGWSQPYPPPLLPCGMYIEKMESPWHEEAEGDK